MWWKNLMKNELGKKLSKNIKEYFFLDLHNKMTPEIKEKLNTEIICIINEIKKSIWKINIEYIESDRDWIFEAKYDPISKYLLLRRKSIIYEYIDIIKKLKMSEYEYERFILVGLSFSLHGNDKKMEEIILKMLPNRITDVRIIICLFFIFILRDEYDKAEKYFIKGIKIDLSVKEIFQTYDALWPELKSIILSYIVNKRPKKKLIDNELYDWFYNDSIGIQNPKNEYGEYYP
jgi:hypothetical protein